VKPGQTPRSLNFTCFEYSYEKSSQIHIVHLTSQQKIVAFQPNFYMCL